MIATEFLATLELKICKINLFSLKFFEKSYSQCCDEVIKSKHTIALKLIIMGPRTGLMGRNTLSNL